MEEGGRVGGGGGRESRRVGSGGFYSHVCQM